MKTEKCYGVEAIAVDYYGTLVDVGQPFIKIKKWFEKTYENYMDIVDNLFVVFSKERARLQHGNEFLLGSVILIRSYIKSCEKYKVPIYTDAFENFVNNLFVEPVAFPNAGQIISQLRKRYPVLLLTNADNGVLHKSISMQKFEFDYILSSEDMRCYKPNKKCFKATCETLNVMPKSTLMIGDSLTEDVHGALLFGMQALWLNNSNRQSNVYISQIQDINDIFSVVEI